MIKGPFKLFFLLTTVLFVLSSFASAQVVNEKTLEKFFPKAFAMSIFNEKFQTLPVEVREDMMEKEEEPNQKKIFESKNNESLLNKKEFLPPDKTPEVAINPEAPSSAISMIESNRRGDRVTAKAYAKQFVRVLQNYFFEVREITSLIGDALIEEKVIESEDWIGAEQTIDLEMAKTRLEKGIVIKPTHDVAMTRIVPDPKKEAEVYFFFSRACSYCRYMASDVERLVRALDGDNRVKITGLIVGDSSEDWLAEFKDYTGLSIPVYDGTEFAKHLKLGLFPVLMLVSPNGKKSYYKTGQQTFERMYEFVRTTQGLPVEDFNHLQVLIRTPISASDKLILASENSKGSFTAEHFGNSVKNKNVNLPQRLKNELALTKF